MSGLQLAFAILPLVIAAVEHHKELSRVTKVLASVKHKADEQLDFYYKLYDELTLLYSTLQLLTRSLPSWQDTQVIYDLDNTKGLWYNDSINDHVNALLGINADSLKDFVHRLLKCIDALVSDQMLGLTFEDTVRVRKYGFV
jgi:hypothetical protein